MRTGLKIDRRTALNLDRLLSAKDPDVFGGVVIDETNGAVRVHALSVDNTSIEQLATYIATVEHLQSLSVISESGKPIVEPDYPELDVELIESNTAYSELNDLIERVFTDRWTPGIQERLDVWWPDYDRGVVVLKIRGFNKADTSAAVEHFGDRVEVLKSDATDAGNKVGTRANDGTPHKGAIRINGPVGCSSAFTVQSKAGTRGVLTAGHCGGTAPGTGIGSMWSNPGGFVGKMTEWKNGNCSQPAGSTCHDIAKLTTGSYSPSKFYIGALSSTTWVPVSGISVPNQTAIVSGSGATTGDVGSFTVGSAGTLCVVIQSEANCGLRDMQLNPGNPSFYGGDSGGVIYQTQNSNYLAVGIIVGKVGSTHYYTPIDVALADFGDSLLTS